MRFRLKGDGVELEYAIPCQDNPGSAVRAVMIDEAIKLFKALREPEKDAQK